MILVDANILVYAKVKSLPEHERARKWLDQRLSDVVSVGLPWTSLIAFMRLVTNPRVFERPESVPLAWRQVRSWLACECVWIPEATDRHTEVMDELLRTPGMQANLVPDAHLAALAIEHGLTICSSDTDFGRFRGVRWHNPLLD